ncbi:hypothetical protein [Streptomyces avidinii]|uniref:Secreted protein n=1 Tax=Streptomyces avidinii TaxID=1895 RepID=A0ABS4L8C7_STRAV|nr:hypothetical protein [Streptomyces avidinii]MBP2038372.1 hypothetical protein [Streptomyces avidinii]GGZ14857.1 hypothetical protein GCM10010343_47440 [Streptomyces avidinii]
MVAGRRIRFTAVLVAVVFALTGFSSHGGSSSSGSSGKSKSKSSSSGGGCSSSKNKKKSHGSGSRSTAGASPSASATGAPATAVVVTCAGSTPVTTVRLTSNVDRRATFVVNLYREGANGAAVESTVVKETLGARESRVISVPLKEPARATEVKTCRLDRPLAS